MMPPVRAILWTAVSTQAQADDEKASLPAQEADLRALAKRQGWEVTDVLTVPGHSRRYVDWHELVKDSLDAEIDAFLRLDKHLKRRDFDVLAVRDSDRFARTQTLTAYIVESTINAGAIIWSLADGQVDRENYRMFAAMAGFRAAGQIDQLIKYRDMAMNLKAERGLCVTGKPFWSHKIVRDDRGKAVGYVVDESKRRAFNDLAELVLTGMGWEAIGREMTRRGHDGGNRVLLWYGRILHPTWWGHAARNFGKTFGAWAYDFDAPAPNGVVLWRNVYPSVYTGEQAEAVMTELRRRHSGRFGKRYPMQTRRFAGLLVCASCGRTLTGAGGKRNRGKNGYRCQWVKRGVCDCQTANYINEGVVEAHIAPLLKALKASADPESVFTQGPRRDPKQAIEDARKELDETREKVRAMARLYAEKASTPLADVYLEELRKLEDRAAYLQEFINRERAASAKVVPFRRMVQELDADALWSKTDHEINQTLHAIFGQWRLVVQDHRVIGYRKHQRVSLKTPGSSELEYRRIR